MNNQEEQSQQVYKNQSPQLSNHQIESVNKPTIMDDTNSNNQNTINNNNNKGIESFDNLGNIDENPELLYVESQKEVQYLQVIKNLMEKTGQLVEELNSQNELSKQLVKDKDDMMGKHLELRDKMNEFLDEEEQIYGQDHSFQFNHSQINENFDKIIQNQQDKINALKNQNNLLSNQLQQQQQNNNINNGYSNNEQENENSLLKSQVQHLQEEINQKNQQYEEQSQQLAYKESQLQIVLEKHANDLELLNQLKKEKEQFNINNSKTTPTKKSNNVSTINLSQKRINNLQQVNSQEVPVKSVSVSEDIIPNSQNITNSVSNNNISNQQLPPTSFPQQQQQQHQQYQQQSETNLRNSNNGMMELSSQEHSQNKNQIKNYQINYNNNIKTNKSNQPLAQSLAPEQNQGIQQQFQVRQSQQMPPQHQQSVQQQQQQQQQYGNTDWRNVFTAQKTQSLKSSQSSIRPTRSSLLKEKEAQKKISNQRHSKTRYRIQPNAQSSQSQQQVSISGIQ